MPELTAQDADAVADALRTHGACRLAGFPAVEEARALAGDLRRLQAAAALRPAAVGRGQSLHRDANLRGDATLWLDDARCGRQAALYLAQLEELRIALNRRLFLGLDEVEAHYARYPPGARYGRHRDSFRASDARVVSLVSYLNDDWTVAQGGALRLFVEEGTVDVLPAMGTGVCFLSQLEHEVLPATRERLSIAAWMRRRSR
ncbi:MAG TPA: 2OG-Fe(II) oxygenase [Pseudoxanthomonas sp.]|nr:2OG-Fe(II) oxygenase [Pseudoxanthomonas sp.]